MALNIDALTIFALLESDQTGSKCENKATSNKFSQSACSNTVIKHSTEGHLVSKLMMLS